MSDTHSIASTQMNNTSTLLKTTSTSSVSSIAETVRTYESPFKSVASNVQTNTIKTNPISIFITPPQPIRTTTNFSNIPVTFPLTPLTGSTSSTSFESESDTSSQSSASSKSSIHTGNKVSEIEKQRAINTFIPKRIQRELELACNSHIEFMEKHGIHRMHWPTRKRAHQ
jgi:hypothetical protein